MNEHPVRDFRRVALRASLIGALTLVMTGCVLRLTGGFAFTNDLGTFIDFIFDDVSTAYCTDVRDFETGNTVVECLYSIVNEETGGAQRTSTAELVSEFGFFGLLIDPLIVQVPENASFGNATVDDGTGPQDLRVTETTSFDVQPGVQSTAEAGHKFWIVELPEALEAALPADLDYRFEYRSPPEADGITTIKAIYTVRVEVNGDTFYLPLYPCTPDFTEVPAINIDVSASDPTAPGASLQNLIFQLEFLRDPSDPNRELACQNEVYNLTQIACDIDNDGDVDRNDISAILAVRNQPAVPGDPRDNDDNGFVNVLDARQCVIRCTLPGCAIL